MFLLVGASVRALMESAAASGHKVTGIDFFGDMDTLRCGRAISLEDLGQEQTVKNLFKASREIPCSGFVYASGPENTPEELEFWENHGLLRGNEGAVLRKVRNPWKLQQCLGVIDVQMPPFYSIGEWEKSARTGRWLLKALNRGSCHGIIELPEVTSSIPGFSSGLNQFSPRIIQRYVEGVSASATFLANGLDAVVLGTSRQLIGREQGNKGGKLFSYEGNIVPLDVRGTVDYNYFSIKIKDIAKSLTLCFGLKGINTVDFILNSEGIWILEVNPRWSASVELIEKYLGVSLFNHHLRGCIGKELPQLKKTNLAGTDRAKGNKEQKRFIGKKIVFAERTLLIGDFKEKGFRYLYEQGVRDIPRSNTEIGKGQPLCTVLAEGVSDEYCSLRLQEKARKIHRFFEKTESGVT